MDNKILFNISLTILLISVILMLINFTFYQFNNWAIRIIGIVMIINIPIISYNAVRILKENYNK